MKEYRYYIFCEGEQTEPRYFDGFKKLIDDNPIYRDMVLIQIEPCGAETIRVIGQAEQYVKDNQITKGQIWCVYDKDSFPAQNFNGVVARAESLNKENPLVQYHAAWSNECIEFWFMLHFAYYASNNHRAEYPNRWEKTENINNQAWIHANMHGPSLIAFLFLTPAMQTRCQVIVFCLLA